jgi:uncharacterized protein YaaN involved in tellurite resistance
MEKEFKKQKREDIESALEMELAKLNAVKRMLNDGEQRISDLQQQLVSL